MKGSSFHTVTHLTDNICNEMDKGNYAFGISIFKQLLTEQIDIFY